MTGRPGTLWLVGRAIRWQWGSQFKFAADPNNLNDIFLTQQNGRRGTNYWLWFSSDGGSSMSTGGWHWLAINCIKHEWQQPLPTLDSRSILGFQRQQCICSNQFGIGHYHQSRVCHTQLDLETNSHLHQSIQWHQRNIFQLRRSVDQSGTTRLWAVTENQSQFTGNPEVVNAANSVGLYMSSNGGANWTNVTSSGPTVGGIQQPWNDTATNTANLRMQWVQIGGQ